MNRRPRTFQPTFDIEGPYEGGISGVAALACSCARGALRWLIRIAIVSAAVYAMFVTTGALLRHFGLI